MGSQELEFSLFGKFLTISFGVLKKESKKTNDLGLVLTGYGYCLIVGMERKGMKTDSRLCMVKRKPLAFFNFLIILLMACNSTLTGGPDSSDDGDLALPPGSNSYSDCNGTPLITKTQGSGEDGASLEISLNDQLPYHHRWSETNSDWIYGGTIPENGPEWDDQDNRNGRGLNCLITFAPMAAREILWQPIPSGYGSRLFFSAWFRTTYDGTGADHLKTWRLADGPIDQDTYPDVSNRYTQDGFVRFSNGNGSSFRGDTRCPDDGRLYPSRIPAHRWGNMSATVQVNSSAGACDGGYEYFTDFVSQGGPDEIVMGSDATDSNVYEMLWLGNYLKNGTQTEYVRWDDVYFDNTWARVELGDAVNYDDCTHREMQIPTAWSPESVTVRVNRGSFPAGRAFLFVINASGEVSHGFELTLP